ncbi:MAG: protein phosphatase 2C domain-containing protein, partial [Erysipelotrichaceae bacterium]|nr:protein phosphatase 2C domain-containing protein [Erysipelotrichaceae bacterium]
MKYFGVSDKGLVRNINQDSYCIITSEDGDVFAMVCDGIGGAKAGDIASRMVVDYFSKHFSVHTGFMDLDDASSWLRVNIARINQQIYHLAQANENYKGMGTTLTGILFTRVGRLIVNIGDSRVYGLNYENEFKQLTEDHSLVNDMLKHQEITL